jgi:hypothetical protein
MNWEAVRKICFENPSGELVIRNWGGDRSTVATKDNMWTKIGKVDKEKLCGGIILANGR